MTSPPALLIGTFARIDRPRVPCSNPTYSSPASGVLGSVETRLPMLCNLGGRLVIGRPDRASTEAVIALGRTSLIETPQAQFQPQAQPQPGQQPGQQPPPPGPSK